MIFRERDSELLLALHASAFPAATPESLRAENEAGDGSGAADAGPELLCFYATSSPAANLYEDPLIIKSLRSV